MSEAGDGRSGEEIAGGGTSRAIEGPASQASVGGRDERAAGGPGTYALDASALLCLVNGELGADRVAAVLSSAFISAVNLAEVATKLNELGADADGARTLLAPLHLLVVPLDEVTAFAAGALRAATRAHGLSLGDRACLALCAQRGAVALTADKAWKAAGELVGVPVELLR